MKTSKCEIKYDILEKLSGPMFGHVRPDDGDDEVHEDRPGAKVVWRSTVASTNWQTNWPSGLHNWAKTNCSWQARPKDRERKRETDTETGSKFNSLENFQLKIIDNFVFLRLRQRQRR